MSYFPFHTHLSSSQKDYLLHHGRAHLTPKQLLHGTTYDVAQTILLPGHKFLEAVRDRNAGRHVKIHLHPHELHHNIKQGGGFWEDAHHQMKRGWRVVKNASKVVAKAGLKTALKAAAQYAENEIDRHPYLETEAMKKAREKKDVNAKLKRNPEKTQLQMRDEKAAQEASFYDKVSERFADEAKLRLAKAMKQVVNKATDSLSRQVDEHPWLQPDNSEIPPPRAGQGLWVGRPFQAGNGVRKFALLEKGGYKRRHRSLHVVCGAGLKYVTPLAFPYQ